MQSSAIDIWFDHIVFITIWTVDDSTEGHHFVGLGHHPNTLRKSNRTQTIMPSVSANRIDATKHHADCVSIGPSLPDAGTWPWRSGPNRPFAKLAESTIRQLKAFQSPVAGISLESADFRWGQSLDHEVTSTNGKFKLWAKQVHLHESVEHRWTCRMVLIQGAKNEILNTWIFPTAPEHHPVFAAELISMGGLPRLTFIDIQNPAMTSGIEQVTEWTENLRARHVALLCDEAPPEWAIDATLGGYIFSRSLPASEFECIDACYEDYLGCYLRGVRTMQPLCDTKDAAARAIAVQSLHRYQLHHMEHSPGGVFLGKLFGHEWTNGFLRNYLFASA